MTHGSAALFVTGASGVGKTASVRALEERSLPGVHLRGQADALDLPVLDTSTLTLSEVVEHLVMELGQLR
jgi:type II secretory pathway predicted ATPase ExeA